MMILPPGPFDPSLNSCQVELGAPEAGLPNRSGNTVLNVADGARLDLAEPQIHFRHLRSERVAGIEQRDAAVGMRRVLEADPQRVTAAPHRTQRLRVDLVPQPREMFAEALIGRPVRKHPEIERVIQQPFLRLNGRLETSVATSARAVQLQPRDREVTSGRSLR